MREVRDDVRRWFAEGQCVALAQVTKTWGSSPRVPGSVMAVSADGRLSGSVSGGCIEGAVAQVAMECATGRLSSLEKFHASTRRAQEVGLSCGGNIEVFVNALDEVLFAMEDALLAADGAYLRLTAVEAAEPVSGDIRIEPLPSADAPEGEASLIGTTLIVADEATARAALETLASDCRERLAVIEATADDAVCAVVPVEAVRGAGAGERIARVAAAAWDRPLTESAGHVIEGPVDWFFARVSSKPQLICIGGVHIAMRLCEIAHVLGFRTVVIDPRRVFATGERFPGVDELVHAWPQEAFKSIPLTFSTAVCALTHDPKIDVPALSVALKSPAFYIGSLGRITTQLSRYRALVEAGHTDEEIDRIFGPIGLDLRGREPAEIALSVMAEITAVRHGSPYALTTMAESARKAEADAAAKASR
ncbi:XdhC family protein [Adlercreutzia sp. R21]|uniref:XdhC family protein n=1 Tax=Adlercreutzia wanghongyangiae TaxID=3111451 RepID=A0ABU6IGD6_9ACTN|nr:XdhC family protein [Adlercreutzia sp. R21]MEC4175502.1 XdhC family protein [Adlercreutzia sp. R7]MEC4183356.1 XdhC family protein [Adlercreutzia sp. R21]